MRGLSGRGGPSKSPASHPVSRFSDDLEGGFMGRWTVEAFVEAGPPIAMHPAPSFACPTGFVLVLPTFDRRGV